MRAAVGTPYSSDAAKPPARETVVRLTSPGSGSGRVSHTARGIAR